jgi:hypothetical protein
VAELLFEVVEALVAAKALERVVDLVHDVGGTDHPVVEVAAVEALESLLTA